MIGITNDMGQTVARYRYDAWGACTIVADTSGRNIATINPFRYRGYYLDSESGLYYLQSRYYDPTTGRFINGDDVVFLGNNNSSISWNLYAYCENTPVNMVDLYGYVAVSKTNNYYTISFNDWETSALIGAVTVGIEVAGFLLAVIAAIPTIGIGTAVGIAICTAGAVIAASLSYMNQLGNHKGLNLHLSRKIYLPSYIGINRKEPAGFDNIWDVFTAVKANVKTIVRNVGVAVMKRLERKYYSANKAIRRILVIVKMIYDAYRGKNVKKRDYAML